MLWSEIEGLSSSNSYRFWTMMVLMMVVRGGRCRQHMEARLSRMMELVILGFSF